MARFDAIIIGAGQAGPPLAARLCRASMSVALVERQIIGGTFVNTGSISRKTLIASARVAHVARGAAKYGVRAGSITVDWAAVQRRVRAVVNATQLNMECRLRQLPGCTVVEGHARLVSPTAVRVGTATLEAKRVFLNVGTRAVLPSLPGAEHLRLLTNTSAPILDTLPRHLIIVGGSYIGLEFAQAFRRLGAEVTIVEKGHRLVGGEDPDISDALRGILEQEGIVVHCGAGCTGFGAKGREIGVRLVSTSGEQELRSSHVLLAAGRKPNTDDLGLAAAGVATDDYGFITVNDELRTNVPSIWALGDCNGRGAFTHTAYNDHEIVADNLLNGANRKVRDRIPAYALFTDPTLGRVGSTEEQARHAGHQVRTGYMPMTRVSRAVEQGETAGFMKVVVDGETDQILGAAILGVSGEEAIHSVIGAMSAGVTASDFTRAVPIHSTISELLPSMFGELTVDWKQSPDSR